MLDVRAATLAEVPVLAELQLRSSLAAYRDIFFADQTEEEMHRTDFLGAH